MADAETVPHTTVLMLLPHDAVTALTFWADVWLVAFGAVTVRVGGTAAPQAGAVFLFLPVLNTHCVVGESQLGVPDRYAPAVTVTGRLTLSGSSGLYDTVSTLFAPAVAIDQVAPVSPVTPTLWPSADGVALGAGHVSSTPREVGPPLGATAQVPPAGAGTV